MRTIETDRAKFIIDAAPYFRLLVPALRSARRQIMILGWDIHSEVAIQRDESGATVLKLGDLIEEILKANEQLEVYILCWDFAPIYVFEREFMTRMKLPSDFRSRIHFELDGKLPIGGSHHQKVVVVDDAVAFTGGIDLTVNRWDTPAHDPEDERRVTPDGTPFDPFHDMQIMVGGPAARALGDLCRERWHRFDGRTIDPPRVDSRPWPKDVAADLEQVRVSLVETVPEVPPHEEVRDTEACLLQAIRDAQRFLYIENQYLTSSCIADALAERLQSEDCPEIVIVNPHQPSGWLEQATMGVVRKRLLDRLRKNDTNDRLRVMVPMVKDQAVYVHAKLLITDDEACYLGSANLSNRSMGLDSECGVLIQARENPDREDHVRAALRGLRLRLLAEHLGADPDEFLEREETDTTPFALIDDFNGGERRLDPLRMEVPEWLEQLIPDSAAVDPEKPLEPGEFFERMLAGENDS